MHNANNMLVLYQRTSTASLMSIAFAMEIIAFNFTKSVCRFYINFIFFIVIVPFFFMQAIAF